MALVAEVRARATRALEAGRLLQAIADDLSCVETPEELERVRAELAGVRS